MKYFLKIYGCQHNEWDGARLDYLLKKLGLTPSTEKAADVIFLLSCSVRKSAVDRVMSTVKNNFGKKIIVCGCVLDEDKKKYEKKNVQIWDINKPENLKEILGLNEQFNNTTIEQLSEEANLASAYLPIIIGCNNFCSYCAVPYVRGREKSRDLNEIAADFEKLTKAGHKEITLLGQNVNSYGKDQDSTNKTTFALLLKRLNDIPGDFIIRFTSNHPKDMTDNIIATIKDLPKVKKEIHLPFQSGSNKILRAMNRPYTKEEYLSLVEKIKKEIPNIKITTDTIIGFPGETEEDFLETVEVLEKVGFAQAFNNKYSPRSGTAAFKLGDPIAWSEKQRRWRIVNEISNKK